MTEVSGEVARKRIAALTAAADLYDEIGDALAIIADRHWKEHKTNPTDLTQLKVRTAFRVRDDYKRSARTNREDVEIYEQLLLALSPASFGGIGEV